MPRQNRVTPFGELIATPARGTLMGNRGRLHDERGRVQRAWQVKRWLLCVLEFKQRRRVIMAPGCYTELFFLDEVQVLTPRSTVAAIRAGYVPAVHPTASEELASEAEWSDSGFIDPDAWFDRDTRGFISLGLRSLVLSGTRRWSFA